MVSPDKLIESYDVTQLTKMLAIDDSVGGDAHSPVEKALETILLWAYQELGSSELVEAKEVLLKTGKVFADDYFFHQSYVILHRSFLFERPIEKSNKFVGKTPFECFLEKSDQFTLKPVQHSIFNVAKSTETSLL